MCSLRFQRADGSAATLGPDRCGPVWSHYHRVTSEWVSFSTGSGPYRTYVYRLSDGALYQLTDTATYGATYGSENIITWRPNAGPHKGKTIVARLAFDE